MPDKTPDELWQLALAAFKGHATSPRTPDLQIALNRIAAKCIAKQPAPVAQSFDPSNCSVHERQLLPEQLCELERYHCRSTTENDQEPVVVLLYYGRKIVIDGNTRVNKWCADGDSRLRSVIFITPR
jgi:hypothetical protein